LNPWFRAPAPDLKEAFPVRVFVPGGNVMSVLSIFVRDRVQAAAVLHDAAELRKRYGREAELWCEAGIHSAPSGATRRLLKQIHRALADLPVEPTLN
jgi:hypothetical protein